MGLFRKDFFRSLALGFALGAVGVGVTLFNSAHLFSPVTEATAAAPR